ncbi:MAG: DUF5606 domain-containing protein [Bacteroidaceae bacterium]|nr:DUF5606 domain-containing protein [Bacteroidaceae bacterium]
MLKKILAISGKPGLYQLVSRGNRSLIVETLDKARKRMPVFGTDKVISLADIAMYTEEEEVPLSRVLSSIQTKEKGKKVNLDLKSASRDDLFGYMGEILPNFDRDRVYPGDVKKLISWYNLMLENGITDFSVEEKSDEA